MLLEPFGMGDAISLEPLVRELQRQGREVRICARAAWRELYPAALVKRWVDARIPWSSYDEQDKYSPAALLSPEFRAFRSALAEAARGTVGVDTRGDPRSVLLLHLAGCRSVLSLSHYLGSDFGNVRAAATHVEFADDLKRWELNLRFLGPLGLSAPAAIAAPRFQHLCLGSKANSRTVGFVPIAPWEGKHWGAARWAALGDELRSAGLEPLGLCGPRQSAAARAELGGLVEVREQTSLAGWAQSFAGCAMVVAVDTGPMHLADALGVPTLAIFGQGKLPLWAPSGKLGRVIHHQQEDGFSLCHPIIENAALGRQWMDRITVEEVLEAVRKIPAPRGTG